MPHAREDFSRLSKGLSTISQQNTNNWCAKSFRHDPRGRNALQGQPNPDKFTDCQLEGSRTHYRQKSISDIDLAFDGYTLPLIGTG